jgi:hypothetical protein
METQRASHSSAEHAMERVRSDDRTVHTDTQAVDRNTHQNVVRHTNSVPRRGEALPCTLASQFARGERSEDARTYGV